jgi:hypothetical protein
MMHRFSKITTVFFSSIFHRNKKTILKVVWNHKRSKIAKGILNKTNTAEDVTLPDFKLYYKAIVAKTYDTGIQTEK